MSIGKMLLLPSPIDAAKATKSGYLCFQIPPAHEYGFPVLEKPRRGDA